MLVLTPLLEAAGPSDTSAVKHDAGGIVWFGRFGRFWVALGLVGLAGFGSSWWGVVRFGSACAPAAFKP